jgi:hypothetical protein
VPAARPYPQPSAAPAYQPATAQPAVTAPADALHAPYEHVLAAVYGEAPSPSATPSPATPSAADPTAETVTLAKAVGWPCSKCGELNDFERAVCAVCMSPFGADLRGEIPQVDRRRIIIIGIAAVLSFLCFVAAITFASTKAPKGDGSKGTPVLPAQQLSDSTQQDAPVDPGFPVGPAAPSPSAVPGYGSLPSQPVIPGATYVPGQNLLQSSGAVPVP